MAWMPDYASVEDLKSFVRVNDDIDAAEMALAITTASRGIDTFTRRQFGNATVTRNYFIYGDGLADIDDLMAEPAEVKVDGVVTEDFQLSPLNAAADGRPWTRIKLSSSGSVVQITAEFGWPEIPEAVTEACLLQASRLLVRRDSPYGVAGSPTVGSELRLLSRLDPDVEVSLRPYKRFRAVVA